MHATGSAAIHNGGKALPSRIYEIEQLNFESQINPKLGAVKLDTLDGRVTILPTGREVLMVHVKLLLGATFPALSSPVKTTVCEPAIKFVKTNCCGSEVQVAVHNTVAVIFASNRYRSVHPLGSEHDTVNCAVVDPVGDPGTVSKATTGAAVSTTQECDLFFAKLPVSSIPVTTMVWVPCTNSVNSKDHG